VGSGPPCCQTRSVAGISKTCRYTPWEFSSPIEGAVVDGQPWGAPPSSPSRRGAGHEAQEAIPVAPRADQRLTASTASRRPASRWSSMKTRDPLQPVRDFESSRSGRLSASRSRLGLQTLTVSHAVADRITGDPFYHRGRRARIRQPASNLHYVPQTCLPVVLVMPLLSRSPPNFDPRTSLQGAPHTLRSLRKKQ